MIVAFTGHRPDKLGGYNLPNPTYIKVCRAIDKHLREINPSKVISGMALGTNQSASNIAIKLGIPLIAAIPFEGQEKKWPERSQKAYNYLLKRATDIVYVSPPGFSTTKMQLRNEWMVDQCDILIGVYNGSAGGTANCIKYAESLKLFDMVPAKKIIIIDPNK